MENAFPTGETTPESHTLLIVDDVPGNLAILGELLQGAGYRVKAATSGMAALRYAATQPLPDLILLDVMMPEMDGYEVLSHLRAHPATRDIPVIFLSALGDSEDEQRGLELALNRMMGDVVMGGTMGAVTDYASMLRDATARGRYKNPVEPPAAALLKETGALAYKLARQGTLSARDYREYVSRMLTAYRYGTAMAYRFADAVGADWAAAKRYQAEQDKRFARAVGRRFGEELNYDQPGASGGLPRVTENTPIFDTLEAAQTAEGAAFDRVMYTPQRADFESLARAYGWQYRRVETRGVLERLLTEQVTGPQLVEVPLER